MKQNEEKETDRILIRITMVVYILLVMIFTVGADLAYAASDPLAVINNLSLFSHFFCFLQPYYNYLSTQTSAHSRSRK